MKIKVKINDRELVALIDTGASNNLVKMSVVDNLKLQINKTKTSNIIGLGMSAMLTKGKVYTELSFHGIPTRKTPLCVVDDHIIDSDLILGRHFCEENNLIIDLSRNRISRVDNDKSRIDIYHDNDNKVMKIIHESIPVIAREEVMINSDLTEVPISINCISDFKLKGAAMYEGYCKDSKLQGMDGIIELEEKDKMVLMKTKTDNKLRKVRKGEIVGRVSTLVEMDHEQEGVEDTNIWTEEKLIKETSIGSELSNDEKHKVYKLLSEVHTLLGKDSNDIGLINVKPHKIELTDNTPIWTKPRQFSEPLTREIDRQCNELEALDIIERSNSKWSSPIVPVRKVNGTLRMCVDYRKLNRVTKTEHFPMPNLTEAIYSANKIKFFTKLDLIKGYYQLPIEESSKQFTAFSTPHSQFQFKRLSFGLKNSGIEFQRTMTDILSQFDHSKVIVYIDDILILSSTFEDHLLLVEKVLNTLRNNGIKINLAKCEFFAEKVSFLGHDISRKGIEKSKEFIEKVRNHPKPTNVTQLRQFLGLANFQRKFIPDFSVITKPLSTLTGGPKRKVLQWTPQMDEAYEIIKAKLVEEVSLSFPDYGTTAEPLDLYVDASGMGMGACLMQRQEGEFKPIAYASRAFTPTEQRYATTERELLAIRFGVKSFRTFLFGSKFNIHTDHKPLLYLQNMCKTNARLMRIVYELEDYDYTIYYRPGPMNEAADSLSRMFNKFVNSSEVSKFECELPKGIKLMEKVDGGGDSLFQSLFTVLDEIRDTVNDIIPDDHVELRKTLVQHLLKNNEKFKIKLDKHNKRMVEGMIYPGVMPREDVLLAACDLYHVTILVHHGMPSPVIYKSVKGNDEAKIVHLQCISSVHYNPARCVTKDHLKTSNKCINVVEEETTIENQEEEVTVHQMMEINANNIIEKDCGCNHLENKFCTYTITSNNVSFCGLLDTGAQVSLITQSVWSKLSENDGELKMEPGEDVLHGIGNNKEEILGIVKLKLHMLGIPLDNEIPFAIVRDNCLPFCSILGANFIAKNNLIIDFNSKQLYGINKANEEINYPLKSDGNINYNDEIDFLGAISHHITGNTGSVHVQLSSDSEESSLNESEGETNLRQCITENTNTDSEEDTDDERFEKKVKYIINDNNYLQIQDHDHAIKMIKDKLNTGITYKKWTENPIKQYKRYHKSMKIKSGILFKVDQEQNSIVLPFKMIVEVVYKTHTQLGHIGRYKLQAIILKQFWHPALNKITRDVCRSCIHCQRHKVSRQYVEPPMYKIQTAYPFELLAMDLLMLPEAKTRTKTVVVAIDHFSKWVSIIPIADKKSSTVSKVLHEKILPNLPKLPDVVLSDNGPEFRAQEFKMVLDQYNIKHIRTTPNKPSSNGCVERFNRTIIQILKGLVTENPKSWIEKLPKAIMIYNNTKHSTTGKSPSDMILAEKHLIGTKIPVNRNVVTWKEGHPEYSPYAIGQRVMRKINRKGTNLLKNKLSPIYDGPYIVTKVNLNKVTYVIQRMEGQSLSINVHCRQIKAMVSIPKYLEDIIKIEPTYVSQIEDGSDTDSSSSTNITYGASAIDLSNISSSDITSGEEEPNNIMPEEVNDRQLVSSKESFEVRRKLNKLLEIRKAFIDELEISNNENSQRFALENQELTQQIRTEPTCTAEQYIGSLSKKPEDQPVEQADKKTKSSENQMNESCSEISSNSFGNSNHGIQMNTIIDTFGEIMEQAWSVSAQSIDEEISNIEQSSRESITVFSTPAAQIKNTEDDYEGFDDGSPDLALGAERLKFLKKMKSNAIYYKDLAGSFKKGNNNFLRTVWEKDFLNSESRMNNDETCSDSEVLTPRVKRLNFDIHTSTPRIGTRSRVKARDLPHVQPKTLEYKVKNRNNN